MRLMTTFKMVALAAVAVTLASSAAADAGWRQRRQQTYQQWQPGPCAGGVYQPATETFAGPTMLPPASPLPAGPSAAPVPGPAPVVNAGSDDALDEVNRDRARRGLRPFLRDEGLTVAARLAARFRASRLIAGHVNDFQFVPPGTVASSAGCGAWPVGLVTTTGSTWGTCCTYENYTYAGAAWAMGADGKRYMHLFVR